MPGKSKAKEYHCICSRVDNEKDQSSLSRLACDSLFLCLSFLSHSSIPALGSCLPLNTSPFTLCVSVSPVSSLLFPSLSALHSFASPFLSTSFVSIPFPSTRFLSIPFLPIPFLFLYFPLLCFSFLFFPNRSFPFRSISFRLISFHILSSSQPPRTPRHLFVSLPSLHSFLFSLLFSLVHPTHCACTLARRACRSASGMLSTSR